MLRLLISSFIISMAYSGISRTRWPVIAEINPKEGGLEGGNLIHISGVNFAEFGLNTNPKIYVGDSECSIISYYTTDTELVCVAPACSASACLESSDFRGFATTELVLYIQTVETILSASASYKYSYSQTPIVTQISHTTWATASTRISGIWKNTDIKNIGVKINNQFATLDDNSALNFPTIQYQDNNNLLYYHPPSDMAAGNYNLTVLVQDSGSAVAPGLAKLFGLNFSSDFMYNASYGPYFQSSLSGVSSLVTLMPTIYSISTPSGSVAGGTLLKIKGAGFPNDIKSLVVYAAGELCEVQTVASDSLTCLTSPSSVLAKQQATIVSSIEQTSFSNPFLNSSRSYGSSGIWVKLWTYNDVNYGKDGTSLLSFPWRDGFDFNMWYNFYDSNWPTQAGVSSFITGGWSNSKYDAEIRTTIVIPLTGNYTFYVGADDNFVFADANNQKIVQNTYYSGAYGNYFSRSGQISSPIFLKRGQRYPIRASLENTGGPDNIKVAIKISPKYSSDGVTLFDYNPAAPEGSQTTAGPLPLEHVPAALPDNLKLLQGFKEIQDISFNFVHYYEKQVVNITGATSGKYKLVLQGYYATVDIDMTATPSQISTALYNTALLIPTTGTNARQCSWFGVTVQTIAKSLIVTVEFQVENSQPLTKLIFLPQTSLVGSNILATITQTQFHSIIPSGSFNITIPMSDVIAPATIPFSSMTTADNKDVKAVKKAIESLRSDIIVQVARTSNSFNVQYSYRIYFVSPIGNIPSITIDTTGLVSSGVTVPVTTVQHGNDKALWFDPIPTWMMEIPLDWSSEHNVKSNVEVFVKVPSESGTDVLKAVCDGSGTSGGGFIGFAKGNEKSCKFSYSLSDTALVTSSSIVSYEADNTAIVNITGQGFSKSANNNTQLSVTIGDNLCVVTSSTDSVIICSVQGVPAGTYSPKVIIPGLGYALDTIGSSVTFVQQVFSVTQIGESVAGGGILEFRGRGFSVPSVIQFLDHPMPSVTPTYAPSFRPDHSFAPSVAPSIKPSLAPTFSHTPTLTPSYKPTIVPSVVPTFKPSVLPTFKPTFKPSSPTLMPTPTIKPSRSPNYSRSPTIAPSVRPSAPTAIPSYKPSSMPSNSNAPFLSYAPSSVPTFAPSYSHFVTTCTSIVSTTSVIQCRVPSLPHQYLDRLVTGSHFSTGFGIILNGIELQNFASLTYSQAETPVVTKIIPNHLSYANTVELKIEGDKLANTTSVKVGASDCVIHNSSNSLINCRLLRDKDVPANFKQTVTVDVLDKGYAISNGSLTDLPTVVRGFHVTNLSTNVGSYWGGNVLSIVGVGFSEKNKSKYTVTLHDTNVGIDIVKLNQVLQLLGQPTLGNEFVQCEVIYVSYSMINCTLPHFLSTNVDVTINTVLSTIGTKYSVVVSANGVNSVCFDPAHTGADAVNSTVCTYTQSASATPNITSVAQTAITSINEVSFTLSGQFLSATTITAKVWIGDVKCTVLSANANTISVVSPPLSAGMKNITLLIDGVGYANSNFQLSIPLLIYQLKSLYSNAVTVSASMGGGFDAVLEGAGFNAENCSANTLQLQVDRSYGSTMLVDGTRDIVSCTTTRVHFKLPFPKQVYTPSSSVVPTTAYDYLGCFTEGSPRALKTLLGGTLSTSTNANPVNTCYNRAKAAGLTVFGIFNGNKCYGTNDIVMATTLYGINCNCARCANNNLGYCGTYNANSVYQIYSTTSTGNNVPITTFLRANTTTAKILQLSVTTHSTTTLFSSFDWQYVRDNTPVATMTPQIGYEGTTLVSTFTMTSSLLLSSSNISVHFAETPCRDVTTQVSAPTVTVSCKVPALSAGYHNVLVYFSNYGYALEKKSSLSTQLSVLQFESLLSVQPLAITSASPVGGKVVTIHGKGFSDVTNVSAVTVTVCGSICPIVTSSYSALACQLPSYYTTDTITAMSTLGITKDLITSVNNNGTLVDYANVNKRSMSALIDQNYVTNYVDGSCSCAIGLVIKQGYKVQPYRVRFYPQMQKSKFITSAVFEGSTDGGSTFINLGTLINPHEGWNFITADPSVVSSNGWFTHLRYRPVSVGKHCELAEIDFLGVVAAISPVCSVNITSPSGFSSGVSGGTVTYGSVLNSPYIQSLTPNNGTALGGTIVTLIGNNLLPVSQSVADVEVLLSGIACNVQSVTNTKIVCKTNPRPPEAILTTSTVVTIVGTGNVLVDDNALFLYIDKWSEVTSWLNQEPPIAGDLVYIPDGQVILLDVFSPVLEAVIIEGALHFDPTQDVSLDATYLFIHGGLMQVGTHEHPYEKNAVITLHGDRYKTIEIPYIGSKVLAVANRGVPFAGTFEGVHVPGRYTGQLEIHGKNRLRTWTKLAETAYPGDTKIITAEDVDFAPGEVLILPGTEGTGGGGDMDGFGGEEVTVLSNKNKRDIVLTQPLRYIHRSEIITVQGTDRVVDMRCPVGLLTRNVIVQGDDKSYGQMFGVHTVAMMSGIFRMENAEIRNCGQAFNFGRYCTHTHMGGNMEGSYVKANTIHHSFQRAVTTHDSVNWEVRDNVAYDIMGHAYFVEDGTEMYNTLSGNLGVLIRSSSALLESDHQPAVFWTATPLNYWYDNVACHSYAHGFWFELRSSRSVCPVHQPLGQFKNNTFFKNGQHGLRIYPEWTPFVDPCDASTGPAPQYLYDMVSYRNGGNGLFTKRMGDLHHVGHTILENGGDEIFIIKYENVDYTNNPALLNVIAVASLDSNVDNHNVGKLALFAPQDEFFYVKNLTIVNYGSGGAISGCNSCLSGEHMKQGAHTVRFEGLKFIYTTKRILWKETKKEIFWDLDGSLAGIPNKMLTMYRPFNAWPECTRLPADIYDDTLQCSTFRKLAIDNISPWQLYYTDIQISSTAGVGSTFFLPLDIFGWVVPVANDHTYAMEWKSSGNSAYQYRAAYSVDEYLLESIENSKSEKIELDYTPYLKDLDPYSFKVAYGNNWQGKTVPLNNTNLINMADGHWYNRTLSLLLTTDGAKTSEYKPFQVSTYAQNCPPVIVKGGKCYIPPPPSIDKPRMWSENAIWPSSKLPEADADVTITNTMWVVLDITPPKLGCIYVQGRLSFSEDVGRNLTLQAKCIVVYGELIITGPDNTAYPGLANIIVYGGIGSSLPVTIADGLFLGSKVIAVAGKFIAKGKPVASTFVRLESTASQGDMSVTLSSTVDWSVGDQIVLSNTGYYDSNGNSLMEGSNNLDYNIIVGISGNVLLLQTPLTRSHLCHTEYSENFCGYVAKLTRTVNIRSADSFDGINKGYGGHIAVFDLATKIGQASFQNVGFYNLGKTNSDHFALSYKYTYGSSNGKQKLNLVDSCTFQSSYNFGVYAAGAQNLTISNNVVAKVTGGGMYVGRTCSNVVVSGNLVMNVYQLPAVLESSYPWNRPIAAFTVYAGDTQVFNNVASGSVDSGYYITQNLFTDRVDTLMCESTHGGSYTQSGAGALVGKTVYSNEAVGNQVGLFLVTYSSSEASGSDCASIVGFKIWRSANVGILSADTKANVLITASVLAENHIGTSLNFFKGDENIFTGMINSKVIGLLQDYQNTCGFSDTNWAKVCRSFTQNDPSAVINSCSNPVLDYNRVGIMLPQFTNAPRTCAVAGRFAVCDPPSTVDRLCALPYTNRFGVAGIGYPEQHIHNVIFAGFSVSSCLSQRSSAIAVNPDQIDQQPAILMSGTTWSNVDTSSRFGFRTLEQANSVCEEKPCMGTVQIIVHDQDGSVTAGVAGGGRSGQLLFDNPAYVAPAPLCSAMTDLGSGFFYCSSAASTPFKQFTAIWHDQGPQIIEPLVITRNFGAPYYQDRAYAATGPTKEMCAIRMFYSRFPFMIASGMKNKIMSTGTIPNIWNVRWDAPTVNDVAILEFFVQSSWVVNVFVGQSENDPNYQFVPIKTTDPTLSDVAGTNCRNPQNRTLTVTVRGGPNRFYKFVQIPVVQVTVRMQMTTTQFFGSSFIANLALLLQIPVNRIKVANVQANPGALSHFKTTAADSIDVSFTISPSNTTATTNDQVTAQTDELQTVANFVNNTLRSPQASQDLGPLVVLAVDAPPTPVFITDTTSNTTQYNTTSNNAAAAVYSSLGTGIIQNPTPAPVTQPTTPGGITEQSSSSLSAGVIAAITIVPLLFMLLGCFLLYRCIYQRRKEAAQASKDDMVINDMLNYDMRVYDSSVSRQSSVNSDTMMTKSAKNRVSVFFNRPVSLSVINEDGKLEIPSLSRDSSANRHTLSESKKVRDEAAAASGLLHPHSADSGSEHGSDSDGSGEFAERENTGRRDSTNSNAPLVEAPRRLSVVEEISEAVKSRLTQFYYGGGTPCACCKRPVYRAEQFHALSQTWHRECFKCGAKGKEGACHKRLKVDQYISHNGEPFCVKCDAKLFAHKGQTYGLAIESQRGITVGFKY